MCHLKMSAHRVWLSSGMAVLLTWVLPLGLQAQNEYWAINPEFQPILEGDPGVGGVVLRMVYPGGRLLVGTSYSYINGIQPASWLTRLNADGSLDQAFQAPGSNGAVLVVYPDGRILCGIIPVENPGSRLVLRLLPDGSADPTFSPLAIGYDGMHVRILPDQRLLLAGSFTSVGGVACRYLVRLLEDGTLDPSFTSPFAASANLPAFNSVEQTVDGQHILIAGGALGLGAGLNYVARLNADGSVDSSFNTGTLNFPWSLRQAYPQTDGSVVLSNGSGDLINLTATGATELTFAPMFVGMPLTFSRQQPDGTIYYTTMLSGESIVQLRRLTAFFQDDPTFPGVSTPYSSPYQVNLPEVMDDGVVIVGAATAERYAARHMLTRVLAGGTVDATYNPRFSRPAEIEAQAILPDGRLLLAGAIDHVNGVSLDAAYVVLRLLPDGSLDPGFSAPLPAGTNIDQITVCPDGRILLLGRIPVEGGAAVKALYLTSTGSIDTALAQFPELAVPQAVDAQGRILTRQSDFSPPLRRWLADGTEDVTFTAPPVLILSALAPLSDGRLLVVETGSGGNGTLRCLTEGGGFDATFTAMPVALLGICGLIPLANGESVICHRETTPPGYYALRLRRLAPDGTVVASYTSHSTSSSVASVEAQMEAMGVIRDWYVASGAGPTSPLAADLTRPFFRAFFLIATGGTIYRFDESAGFGSVIQAYARTATDGPSFDPGPFEVAYIQIRTNLLPVNGRFAPYVIPSGLEPFTYVWFKDGLPIPDATGQQLYLRPLQASDSGTYAVQVSNAYGSAMGSDLNLTIDTETAAAWVAASPVSQTAVVGSGVTFSTTVLGNPAPTLQWYFNGNAITGEEGPTLTIAAVSPSMAGTYHLRAHNTVVNAGGSLSNAVYSAAATLTVVYRFDAWQQERFGPLELADAAISGPAADPDGDGFVNLCEYALGLAPTSADTTGLPMVTTDDTHWIYTYTRPADRTDVAYTVEFSTDLATWGAPTVAPVLVSASGGVETWQAKEPLTSSNAYFRLKVSQ